MPYSKEDIKRILGPTPFKESEDSIVVELPTEKYRNPEGKKRVTFVFDCKIPQLFRVYAKNAYVLSADQYDAITAYCLIESQHRHFFVRWAIVQSTGELQPKIEYMLMDNRLTDKQSLRVIAVLMGIIENTYEEISNIYNPNQAIVEEESTSVVKEANQDSVESENSGQESGNAQAIPYLSHDTNPAYPGDHYFVTPYYESSLLRVKNFPAVSDANRLFRRFSTEQVEAISSKIRSTETLPVLVFVREILGEYFQYLPSGADPEQNEDFAAIEELKPPFWFLPFCAIGQSFGGILYLEQNGLYSNGARPFLLSSMFPAEKIQRIEWQDGNYETEAEGSAGTLIVSNDEDDVELYLEEFHGNDYGSQLKIVDACLEVWMKVVEKSRKSSFYVLNSVNFIEVHSWDELLEWSQPTSSTIEPINKLDSDSKQMRVEKIRAYLSEEGYAPRVDEDGDLIFKFEESTYMILFDEQDEQFYRIIYPNFWSIDNDSERIKAVKACEAVTGKIKVAKVFTVKNNIWASVELFMGSPEQLILVFKRSLNALRTSVQNFREVMQS